MEVIVDDDDDESETAIVGGGSGKADKILTLTLIPLVNLVEPVITRGRWYERESKRHVSSIWLEPRWF